MEKRKPTEEFQTSLWKLLASQEEEFLTPANIPLSEYEQEYREALAQGGQQSSLSELARCVLHSDLIFVGDNHALPQSRETFLLLLQRLLKHRHNVAIGLEMIHSAHQPHLDLFLQNKISEADLLTAIQYWENWGFDWKSYRKILLFARSHKLRVIALNSNPADPHRLQKRDQHAAELINQFLNLQPGLPLLVLFGEHHVCETHLPQWVEEFARQEGNMHRWTIIHQDSFPELAEAEERSRVRAWKLNEQIYRLINVSPLAALSSHLDWIEIGSREANKPVDREELRVHLLDRIHSIALAFSVLLEQVDHNLDGFQILLKSETERAKEYIHKANLCAEEQNILHWELAHLPVVNLPGTSFLLINEASFSTACEAAGLILARGANQRLVSDDFVLGFANSALRHGLSYFVSKLFDSYQHPHPPSYWLGSLASAEKNQWNVWRNQFREFLHDPEKLPAFSQTTQSLSLPLRCAFARSTGEIFGTKLFQQFSQGKVSITELGNYFAAAKGPEHGLLTCFLGFLRHSLR